MIGDFIVFLKGLWKNKLKFIGYFFKKCREQFCIHDYERRRFNKECKKCGRIKWYIG